MELKDTVTMFCTETFTDVFSPFTPFKGKVNPFAEVANSGDASQRRILETPTTVSIPAGRVVASPAAEKFIVADVNVDFWAGTSIRCKYPILPVDTMGAVGTIGTTLASTQADKAVYAYPYFVRRESDEVEKSEHYSGFEIAFSKTKTFTRGQILTLGSKYYRFKTDSWIDGAGFSVVQATLIESPVQTLTVISRGSDYNTTTDSYTATASVSASCFVEPMKQDYDFVSPAFEDILPGDKAISLLDAAATIVVNGNIGNYKVLSIRDQGTWVTCHCRNIGG